METLAWFAYGFACTSIGIIVGNRLAHRQLDKYIRDRMDAHQAELMRMIDEARDESLKTIKRKLDG